MATLASLVATVVGTAFAVALLRRWAVRGRTPASLWWGLSLVQFALASAALLLGEVLGWSGPVFRAFYLFGAVTNVLWLALGTVVINARRRGVVLTLGTVLLLTAALTGWGAAAADTALWLPSTVVATALAVACLLPLASSVQRWSAVVVVVFTAAAACGSRDCALPAGAADHRAARGARAVPAGRARHGRGRQRRRVGRGHRRRTGVQRPRGVAPSRSRRRRAAA